MYKKQNEHICNIKDINEELLHRDYCNARLNALFLSSVMDDGSSIHSLVHRKRPSILPTLKSLVDYYNHKDINILIDDIEDINMNFPGLNGFCVSENENGQKILIDNTNQQSNWTDLKKYDEHYDLSIEDNQVYPHRHKRFRASSPIEIINDTIDFLKHPAYEHPSVSDKGLNLMLKNLYYGGSNLDEATYYNTLKQLNQHIIKAYKGEISSLEDGHIDAIMMMEELSTEVFQHIDYPKQFGFYKTPLCREMLKFSYLTTFIKKYPFDQEDMNAYLNHIQNSGHWLQAHRRITNSVNQNALQLTGINYEMIALSSPRPLKRHNFMLQKYRQRDLERIAYQSIYLGKENNA